MTFYRRWILANGWAEAAGLGATFLLGRAAAPFFEAARGAAAVLVGALSAVALGTLLEGVVVGVAQERVLRRRLAGLRPGAWILATAVGAGLAWLLGMIPSTFFHFERAELAATSAAAEPPALVQYALAGAMGLLVGPILGLAQWIVLRRPASRAATWFLANALAWAAGMAWIFFAMDHVPWNATSAVVGLAVVAVCGSAGLLVGAIHGRFLIAILASVPGVSKAD